MKQLRYLSCALAFIFVGTFTQAQVRVGGGFTYGSKFEQPGVFARGEFQIPNKDLGIVASGNFYFPKSIEDNNLGVETTLNRLALNLDGMYTFASNDFLDIYGLGGLNVLLASSSTKISGFDSRKESDTTLGFGVGGGIRYKLESNLVPMAEIKYINGGQKELVINIGVLFQL
jgi:opacity protein-like surface antigen